MATFGRRFGRGVLALLTAALLIGSLGVTSASAATVTDAWQAKVGRSGVNGTARVQRHLDATGSIVYRLKGLRASTTLPVTIHRGTCASVGSVVTGLASVRSSSNGTVSRTAAVSASQMKLIAGASSSTFAVRVGSGSAARCGAFARSSVPPYVAAQVTVGRLPLNAAVDGSTVWVTNWGDNTISRIAVATNTVLSVLPLDLPGTAGPDAIAVGFGALWVTTTDYDASGNALPGSLLRIDPTSGAVVATIPLGRDAWAITTSPDAVWVSVAGDGVIKRIDPTSNQETATVTIGGAPMGLAFGEGGVWVANVADGRVVRIDPATNQVVATVQTQLDAVGVAVGGGAVWVSNFGTAKTPDGKLTRIDPTTNQVVASVTIGVEPAFMTFAGGSAWIAMQGEPTVVRVSASTNTVTARIATAGPSWGIAAGATSVWTVQRNLPTPGATVFLPGTVTRIGF